MSEEAVSLVREAFGLRIANRSGYGLRGGEWDRWEQRVNTYLSNLPATLDDLDRLSALVVGGPLEPRSEK